MSEPSVTLRIEELVLHGFPPGDRYRIADAVERELRRLLTERGVPTEWATSALLPVDSVSAGGFELAPGARPDRVGSQIAEAIYGGLGGGGGE